MNTITLCFGDLLFIVVVYKVVFLLLNLFMQNPFLLDIILAHVAIFSDGM